MNGGTGGVKALRGDVVMRPGGAWTGSDAARSAVVLDQYAFWLEAIWTAIALVTLVRLLWR